VSLLSWAVTGSVVPTRETINMSESAAFVSPPPHLNAKTVREGAHATPLAIGKPDGVLSVLPHSREDTWDRRASVLGFWVWRVFGSSGSSGRGTHRMRACACALSGEASAATNAPAVDDEHGACEITRCGPGTTCPGPSTG
jgi:hypothetical protein